MSSIGDEKESELKQAFQLYCIFNPETGHFDKDNTGSIPVALLKNVVRAVGMCPTEQDLEAAETAIGGDAFSLDQARDAVKTMMAKTDDEESILLAYKTMAEDDPDGFISKDKLWQKMRRRLPDDKITDQMISDGKPDDKGLIDYKAFVKRQFEIRGLTIRLPKMDKDPTFDQVKALLKAKYGSESGPAYPYKYKTGQEIFKELGGHGEETRKFLEFGRDQQNVLREAIAYETKSKVVEAKLEELKVEKSPFKSQLILRELDSYYTGHKYVQELDDIEMPCILSVEDIKDEKERDNARAMIPKLEAQKKAIKDKWASYTGK